MATPQQEITGMTPITPMFGGEPYVPNFEFFKARLSYAGGDSCPCNAPIGESLDRLYSVAQDQVGAVWHARCARMYLGRDA